MVQPTGCDAAVLKKNEEDIFKWIGHDFQDPSVQEKKNGIQVDTARYLLCEKGGEIRKGTCANVNVPPLMSALRDEGDRRPTGSGGEDEEEECCPHTFLHSLTLECYIFEQSSQRGWEPTPKTQGKEKEMNLTLLQMNNEITLKGEKNSSESLLKGIF